MGGSYEPIDGIPLIVPPVPTATELPHQPVGLQAGMLAASIQGGVALAPESLIVEANVAVPRTWLSSWISMGWIEETFDTDDRVYRLSFTDLGREVVRVAA